MTISSYQVDSVLRVYTKQNRSAKTLVAKPDSEQAYRDKVTLTAEESGKKAMAYDKISYNLLDILLTHKTEK